MHVAYAIPQASHNTRPRLAAVQHFTKKSYYVLRDSGILTSYEHLPPGIGRPSFNPFEGFNIDGKGASLLFSAFLHIVPLFATTCGLPPIWLG